MTVLAKEETITLQPDDLRDLLQSVAQTSERLEATHTALQGQVARLQEELAEANAQLQRSRALAALGEMAAGIAHEIRNPLASIQLYVQVLAEEVASYPEQARLCEKIDRAVVGLDAIVRDVLSFARDTTIHPSSTSASELFDKALAGCQALLAEVDVIVQRTLGFDCTFDADPGLMTQSLSNVIRNAIEAMRLMESVEHAQHTLRIEASKRTVRCPNGQSAERIALAVQDSGPGIAPETITRMFNPFFTTRKTGTGLGLAIVHRIVDAHGGHIHVGNVKPHGARIEIYLPPRQGGELSNGAES